MQYRDPVKAKLVSLVSVCDNAECQHKQKVVALIMLYLPAIQVPDSGEVRIACPTNDLLALCRSFVEQDTVKGIAGDLFSRNPGLLIYALSRFRFCNGNPAADFNELTRWMDLGIFCQEMEYDSFQEAPRPDLGQHRQFVKWLQTRSRKRAVRYLASVSELERNIARRFVDAIWSNSFQLSSTGIQSQLTSSMGLDSYSDKLPIRHFWNVCGKLQKLRGSFSTELQRSKLVAMKQLAYGASHEINNPLANIATRAQSLLTEEQDASKRQRLSVIYSQAMRAHEMISDMMLFAQPPDVSFESIDIKLLVEQVIGELGSQLNQHQIVIGVRRYPDSEKCELDSTHFAVALKALLQNSIEAIGSVGEIRIQIWKRDNNTIGLSVSDTGCGMEEDVVTQAFDPFYSGREAGRGLGFGLSKVWRIVDLHGGEIEFESDEKWSCRLVISIPQRQSGTKSTRDSRIDNSRAA